MNQRKTILISGCETYPGVKILLKFARIESENSQSAVYDHLVGGIDIKNCCDLHGVIKSNFSRDLKKLNEAALLIDQYFEIEYRKANKA